MPRESVQLKKARLVQLRQRLRQTYPTAHCELHFNSPLQLLIATILSAQCSDRQVNLVTSDLFQRYQSARDFAEAPLPQLEQDIRRIGLFRNKARHIRECCRQLVERHGGSVPQSMKELTALSGVGRKTANVVLGNAFGIHSGVVVDTHVARLSHRLGLTTERDPVKIELALQKLIPQQEWTVFSHWLIWHGRRRCRAQRPDCPGCELQSLCPTGLRNNAPLSRGSVGK